MHLADYARKRTLCGAALRSINRAALCGPSDTDSRGRNVWRNAGPGRCLGCERKHRG